MSSFLNAVVGEFRDLSVAEVIAVATAVAYLLFAIRQNIWCWLFAAVSTALYVVLSAEAKLYMESFLNGFYFVMALYGWYAWYFGGNRESNMPVTRWDLRTHATAIVVICAAAAVSGYLLDRYSAAAFPYLDSMTALSAFWATFLVARKVLENWWYWLAIDAVSAGLYWMRGFELTALLFVFYLLLIPAGLVGWTRSYAAQHEAAAS